MSFVKLDCGIVYSSLWGEDSDTCKVFVTLLALADQNGMCSASLPGIARCANLPVETVGRCIEKLKQPDENDRSGVEEGRRVLCVDGGFFLVNYERYRAKVDVDERRRQVREAVARHKAKKSNALENGNHPLIIANHGNQKKSSPSASASSSASSVFGGMQGGGKEQEAEPTFAEKLEPFDLASETPPDTIPQSDVSQAYAFFLAAWDQACDSTGWNKIGFAALGSRVVAWNRKWDGSKWFREHWPRALEHACRSPFLTGKTKKAWSMTPDWFLKADNAEKIDEGQYDEAGPKQTGKLTAGDIRRMAALAKEKGQ